MMTLSKKSEKNTKNANHRNLTDQNVLVIDDSMTIGILVSEILTGCGAAATMALTSRAALNLFLDDPAKNNLPTLRSVSAEDFDTIFMDVPGDKSWEILDFLSQNNPEVLTRVILIKNETCWTTNSCKIRQIELPIIPKSFLLNDLKHVACA